MPSAVSCQPERRRCHVCGMYQSINVCDRVPAYHSCRTLSSRLNELWNAFPSHIRDTPVQYSPDVSAFLMLTITRLNFLQSHEHIHTLLKQKGQSVDVWESLITAAAESMVLVLRLGSARSSTVIMLEFRDIVGIKLTTTSQHTNQLADHRLRLSERRHYCYVSPGPCFESDTSSAARFEPGYADQESADLHLAP